MEWRIRIFWKSSKFKHCMKDEVYHPNFLFVWNLLCLPGKKVRYFLLILRKMCFKPGVEKRYVVRLTTSQQNKMQQKLKWFSALLTMPKPLTVWITINCGKIWKRWENQTTWPASWEICMQGRKQQLELDMEQQTGSK